MKPIRLHNRNILPAVLTASALIGVALVAFLAHAQRPAEGQPDRPRRQEAPRDERQPAARPGPFAPVENILDEEQRDTYREAMEANRENMQATQEKVRKARRELEDAIYADKLDEKVIREKVAAITEIEAEMAVARAKVFAKVRPSMTPEQVEQWKRAMQMRMEQRPGLQRGPGQPQQRFDDRAPRDEFRDEDRRRPEGQPQDQRRFRDDPQAPREREFRPERQFDRPPQSEPARKPQAPGNENIDTPPPAGR